MNVRVKICGVTSVEDARAAVDAGADAIGINFVPTSPRHTSIAKAIRVRGAAPPFVQVWGIFANMPLEQVIHISTAFRLEYVQLHGIEATDSKVKGPFGIIKAIRVGSVDSLKRVPIWNDHADGILLDGPGNGTSFDWSLVAKARELTQRPIIVAGGLTIDNVADCVRATRPFAVDVASGVESSPGVKDAKLMREFVKRAKAAGAEL